MTDAHLHKRREILFSRFPPGQIPEATDHLKTLEQLEVAPRLEKRAIEVAYDLRQHSLETLETGLAGKGFHLDNTLLSKLVRALVYYVEETQLHNLEAPEHKLKRTPRTAYAQAWEQHLHGDHDDTPPEWREYK